MRFSPWRASLPDAESIIQTHPEPLGRTANCNRSWQPPPTQCQHASANHVCQQRAGRSARDWKHTIASRENFCPGVKILRRRSILKTECGAVPARFFGMPMKCPFASKFAGSTRRGITPTARMAQLHAEPFRHYKTHQATTKSKTASWRSMQRGKATERSHRTCNSR